MLYLLYGPDTYRSRAKLRELREAFAEKSGGMFGLTQVDLEDAPERAQALTRSGSLFSRRQLFIIENASRAPKAAVDRILELAESWARDRDAFAIFWEGELGEKENAVLGRLRELAKKVQEFKLLPPAKVLEWLGAAAERRAFELSLAEKRVLVDSFGGDLWALSSELDKLQSGARMHDRRREEEKIWSFTDQFFSNRRAALRPLENLLTAGYEPIYLLGALARSARDLALVAYGLASRRLATVARHLHPYVVKKLTAIAQTMRPRALGRLFQDLLRADMELKTGKLPPPLPLLKLLLRPAKSKSPV